MVTDGAGKHRTDLLRLGTPRGRAGPAGPTMQPIKTRARRKSDRPREILDAAFEEFSRTGFAATRLEDIAARAGVTKGTIYFYFPDKEQLFVALIRELTLPLLADADAFVQASDGSAIDFLRHHIRLFYKILINDPRGQQVLRLMIAESGRFPVLVDQHFEQVMGPVINRTREIIQIGIARGEIRASVVQDYPEIVMGPAVALSAWLLLYAKRQPVDVERYLEAHIDILLHGLLPRDSFPVQPAA